MPIMFPFSFLIRPSGICFCSRPWNGTRRGDQCQLGNESARTCEALCSSPPTHDTLVNRVRDTLIKKDTIIIKDTVKIKDTIIQIKMKPTEKRRKGPQQRAERRQFSDASAELTTDSYSHLTLVADFLKKYRYLRYEIQGHTDSRAMRVIIFSSRRRGRLRCAITCSARGFPIRASLPSATEKQSRLRRTRPRPEGRLTGACNSMSSIPMKIIKKLKVLEGNFQEQIKSAQIKVRPRPRRRRRPRLRTLLDISLCS